MSAKSFFYTSAGIFLLAATYTMGAHLARADFDSSGFPIVGFSGGAGVAPVVLRSDGTVWGYDGSWHMLITDPIPIPVSEVAHFDWVYLASKSGEVWQNMSTSGWASLGHVPTPPVSVDGPTWSGVKERYRK